MAYVISLENFMEQDVRNLDMWATSFSIFRPSWIFRNNAKLDGSIDLLYSKAKISIFYLSDVNVNI